MIYNLFGHLFPCFFLPSCLLAFSSSRLLAFIFIRIQSKYTFHSSLFTFHQIYFAIRKKIRNFASALAKPLPWTWPTKDKMPLRHS